MNKDQAIKRIREIQSGTGVDRTSHLDWLPRGRVAVDHWDDGLFTLGIEYGTMLALIDAFGITAADLKRPA